MQNFRGNRTRGRRRRTAAPLVAAQRADGLENVRAKFGVELVVELLQAPLLLHARLAELVGTRPDAPVLSLDAHVAVADGGCGDDTVVQRVSVIPILERDKDGGAKELDGRVQDDGGHHVLEVVPPGRFWEPEVRGAVAVNIDQHGGVRAIQDVADQLGPKVADREEFERRGRWRDVAVADSAHGDHAEVHGIDGRKFHLAVLIDERPHHTVEDRDAGRAQNFHRLGPGRSQLAKVAPWPVIGGHLCFWRNRSHAHRVKGGFSYGVVTRGGRAV
eukprot:6327828-Prymnesium_polylepis.1